MPALASATALEALPDPQPARADTLRYYAAGNVELIRGSM